MLECGCGRIVELTGFCLGRELGFTHFYNIQSAHFSAGNINKMSEARRGFYTVSTAIINNNKLMKGLLLWISK